jgi:hypothetical protein
VFVIKEFPQHPFSGKSSAYDYENSNWTKVDVTKAISAAFARSSSGKRRVKEDLPTQDLYQGVTRKDYIEASRDIFGEPV